MKPATASQFVFASNRAVSRRLSEVKKALIRRLEKEFSNRLPLALIRRAVDEADELAHETGYPHLVLPLLAEETVRRVSEHSFSAEPANEAALAFAC